MNQIAQLKERINEIIHKDGLILYDVEWVQEGKMKILRVSIMKKDGTMDIDVCAEESAKISEMLDTEDLIPNEYYLEVCSPGAERELRSEAEIEKAIHEFIYIKFKEPKEGMDEIKGYLIEIQETGYLIEYMDKAVKRKKVIDKDNIALIRLSVKI